MTDRDRRADLEALLVRMDTVSSEARDLLNEVRNGDVLPPAEPDAVDPDAFGHAGYLLRPAEPGAGGEGLTCETYERPDQDCWTAGPEVVAAEGVCGPCAMRAADRERRAEARGAERAWDEAVQECHDLGWLHDWAKSDALARNPYRADRGEGQ